jgi:hypothetical protein
MKRTLPSLVSFVYLLLLSACGKIATEPAEAAPPVVPVLGQHEVKLPKEVVLDNFNRVLAFSLYPTRVSASPSLGKSTDPQVDLIANLMENESGCFDGGLSSTGLERLASYGFARIRAIDIALTPSEGDGRPSNQDPAFMCFGVRTEGGRWEWRPKKVELVFDAAAKRLSAHFDLEVPLRADAIKLFLGSGPRLQHRTVERVTYEVVE